uniref:Selenoprotein W n=1 Tax=Taeniopygia guttata TaxID=59729 RepID=A0A674HUU0_TAEGU
PSLPPPQNPGVGEGGYPKTPRGGYPKTRPQLRRELERRFPGALDGTPEVTGWFEVTVGGRLVHSKKNGDGFVDSEPKLRRIAAAIESRLA